MARRGSLDLASHAVHVAENGEAASPPRSKESYAELAAKVAALERQVAALLEAGAGPGSGRLTQAPSLASVASWQSLQLPPDAAAGLEPPEPETVTMGQTRVVMHQIVLPSEVDVLGICFGGQVLSWIDICAGLAAKAVARGPVVTASVDSVHFLRPCRLGSVAIIAAQVNRVFQSSMEVGVRVEEEDMASGARHHCCAAHLTFVSLLVRGAPGRPRRAPKRVAPANPAQAAVHAAAEARRRERLAQREAARSADPIPRLQPVTHREGSPTLAPALPALPVPPDPTSGRAAPAAAVTGGANGGFAGRDGGSRGGQGGAGPAAGPGPGPGPRRRVEPQQTTAHMTQLIMPQHANSLGVTFGGQVMRWMEQCAYIAASRVGRGGFLLTGSMDRLAFAKPTRVGDIMYITAQVTGIFASSMEVMVSVCGETPAVGQVFHCGDAYASVVSVNRRGQPVPVPFALAPLDAAEAARCAGAAGRRAERLRMREGLLRQALKRTSLDGTRPPRRSLPALADASPDPGSPAHG